jgi:hypothetical protein
MQPGRGCNPARTTRRGMWRGRSARGCSVTRVEMWVTRDANQHLISAASAKKGLPFARTASAAGRE